MTGSIKSNFGDMDGHMDWLSNVTNGVQASVDALRATNEQLMSTFSGETAQAYSAYHRALNQKIQTVQERLGRVRAAGQTTMGTGGTLHTTDRAAANRFTV